eukprot:10039871-Prorocentrum_lima.AAC.1
MDDAQTTGGASSGSGVRVCNPPRPGAEVEEEAYEEVAIGRTRHERSPGFGGDAGRSNATPSTSGA